ncbi:hypothetical protein M569_15405 [Genlisea aurea]|uniref:SWIM-type domain-containing protein n=1 Tax=Genlisea aurea TaxID=192259 RepID=S8D9S0_9LAMI|nr:hypothetical protein M569_15405 [Genlisea aurea]
MRGDSQYHTPDLATGGGLEEDPLPGNFADQAQTLPELNFFDPAHPHLRVGMNFLTRQNVIDGVIEHHVKIAMREFGVVKNDATQYRVRCRQTLRGASSCPFYLRAGPQSRTQTWRITKLVAPHTCELAGDLHTKHRNLGIWYIASRLIPFVGDGKYKVGNVLAYVSNHYHYEITRWHAWACLTRAHELRFGHGDRVLRRVFWAFGFAIEAFRYCRPVLAVDATHLRGRYNYKLLVCVTVDASNHVLPIAYAFVFGESFKDWAWFLQAVALQVMRGREGVCVISDRAPGIIAAFQNSKGISNIIWRAACARTEREFELAMMLLQRRNPRACEYLMNIPLQMWTLLHDGGHRLVTFEKGREYFERYRRESRSRHANGFTFTQPTQEAYDAAERLLPRLRTRVFDSDTQDIQIRIDTPEGPRTTRVFVSQNRCDCGVWQVDRYPCCHAQKACWQFRIDPKSRASVFLRTSVYVKTYNCNIHPLRDESEWSPAPFRLVVDHVRKRIFRGRLRTARYKGTADYQRGHRRHRSRPIDLNTVIGDDDNNDGDDLDDDFVDDLAEEDFPESDIGDADLNDDDNLVDDGFNDADFEELLSQTRQQDNSRRDIGLISPDLPIPHIGMHRHSSYEVHEIQRADSARFTTARNSLSHPSSSIQNSSSNLEPTTSQSTKKPKP